MQKLLVLFLFISATSFCQETKESISVLSADKMNVVYRGIVNPISIAVPGAKSFKASGLGLTETEITGKYTLSPGAGKEIIVKIEAIMQNDSVVIEEKIFRIKNIRALGAFVNNSFCYNCILEFSKKDLETAEIELKIDDFFPDYKFYPLESFTVNLPNKKIISVEGNKLNDTALNEIKKLKAGSIFTLSDFYYSYPTALCFPPKVELVKIMIVEEKKMERY